jgi:selenium metabolism protein YedF
MEMTMKTVDARGLACPQPVIRTRNALREASSILTIVDNEAAQQNVTRMAERSGATVQADERTDGIYLRITRKSGASTEPDQVPSVPLSAGPLVLVVPSEHMGRGEHEELGHVLARAFFHTLAEVEPVPDTVIFLNSGVKLVVDGSPVVEDLRALVEDGVQVLACGTCLGHYDLMNSVAVGAVSNMYTIAEAMLGAGRQVTL